MALTQTRTDRRPHYLRLLRSPPPAGCLLDADNQPLPSLPRPGMIFEVCWDADEDTFESWRICRVNTRSFYFQTWSQAPQRRLLREWDTWLRELMQYGELRLVEDAPPPNLRCISGGLDDAVVPLGLLD